MTPTSERWKEISDIVADRILSQRTDNNHRLVIGETKKDEALLKLTLLRLGLKQEVGNHYEVLKSYVNSSLEDKWKDYKTVEPGSFKGFMNPTDHKDSHYRLGR
jgi:hypothetical protein